MIQFKLPSAVTLSNITLGSFHNNCTYSNYISCPMSIVNEPLHQIREEKIRVRRWWARNQSTRNFNHLA